MENTKIALKKQMEGLIRESQDVYFSEYLWGLMGKLEQDAITTDYALSELNRTYNMYRQRMEQGAVQQGAPQPQPTAQMQPRMATPIQSAPRPIQQIPQPVAAKKQKSNVEFAIGAGVLSIVGVLFVLVAFVMLGITYMNGFVKGMCMYVIALAILLFSELVLEKKMPKFAVGITALGISSLYLSTMLNYLYLENFDGFMAMALSVLISLMAVFIGRKKDSGTIKIISFIGCYICVFPVGKSWSGWIGMDIAAANIQFLVVSAIVFIINLMTIFLPVKKSRVVVHIFHLVSNAIFSVLFAVQGAVMLDEFTYILYFLISAVLMQGLIFYQLEKTKKENPEHFSAETAGNVTAYITTVMLMLVTFVVVGRFVDFGWKLHVAMGTLLLVCAFIFVLFAKSKLKWIQYWLFSFVAWITYGAMNGTLETGKVSYWWCVGIVLVLFLLSKILSRVKVLRVSELVVTIITAFYALFFFHEEDMTAAICFLGAFLLSVIALNYWQSVYEEILLVVLESFVLMNFQNELTPAIMTGILFLGVIGFNNVELFRGKYIKVFNYVNFAIMVCLYIVAAFEKNDLSYMIMLVLGISFMVFAFKEKYGMDFKIKHIIFVLFLCYMTLIWDIPIPVLKSIILMVIAIGAVTTGFFIRDKKLRITGLALTLVVCGKITLHDFAGAANMEKIILFLIVGLIVLAISGIYIALEKRVE